MAQNIYLGRGDGSGADGALNLNDGTNYAVVRGPVGLDDLSQGRVSLVLNVLGTSADNVWANYRALEALLYQANRRAVAIVGPTNESARVALSLQWNTTAWAYIDVVGGRISQATDPLHTGILYRMLGVTIEFATLGYARGDRISDAASSAITGNGTSYLYRADIPGDMPALVRAAVIDQSTNSKVINALTFGALSLPSFASGTSDYVPYNSLATSGGSTQADSDSANATNYARDTITANADWNTVATLTGPTAQYTRGSYVALLRNRVPSTTLPSTPTALAATAATWFSVVQSASNNGAGAGVNATSITVTFAQASKAGGTLVAAILFGDETATGVNDASSHWTVADVNQRASGPKVWLLYWEDADSVTSVTFTVAGASSNRLCAAMAELDHVPAGAFDQHASANASSGTGVASGTTPYTTQAFEYLVGAFGTAAATTFSPPTSWTELKEVQDSTSSATFTLELAWFGATTAGTKSGSATAGSSAAHAGAIGTFRLDGGLTAGDYDVAIVGVNTDGAKSAASSTLSKTGITAAQYLPLTWTGDATDHYEIYWRKNSGPWYRIVTPTADTSYDLYQEVGLQADPPTQASYGPARLRLRTGLQSGTVVRALPDVAGYPSAVGWGWSVMGAVHLPPFPTPEGGSTQRFYAEVQAKGLAAGNVDIDCLTLLPLNLPTFRAWYVDSANVPLNLATKRGWLLETRRDGLSSGMLTSLRTLGDAGSGAVTFPASATLDETQGWCAVRVTLSDIGVSSGFLGWFDAGGGGVLFYYYSTHQIGGGRYTAADSTSDYGKTSYTPTVNVPFVAILEWTAASVFVTATGLTRTELGTAGTAIPTLAATTGYLGSDGAVDGPNVPVTGTIHWAITGTGALTAADRTALLALGDIQPKPADVPADAGATLFWDGASVANALGVEAGQVETRGALLAGPGDTTLVVIPEIGTSVVQQGGEPHGISDMVNAIYTLQLDITPRYRRLVGAVT